MRNERMDLKKRLLSAFTEVIVIFATVSILVVAIMVYMVGDYNKVLDNYAFPQGDIGRAMNATAEVRSATRAIIGYETQELKDVIKEQHETAVAEFEYYRERIRPTMVTPDGEACMEAIDQAWDAYIKVNEEIILLGSTTDFAKCEQAQEKMIKELAPLYEKLDDAMKQLMDVNVEKGYAEQKKLETLEMIIVVILVLTISTVFSRSIKIAGTIAKEVEDIEKLP